MNGPEHNDMLEPDWGRWREETLRLVAQYADACKLLPTPEIPRKLDILRQHCKEVGRNYDDIEKTAMFSFDVGENGETSAGSLAASTGLPGWASRP